MIGFIVATILAIIEIVVLKHTTYFTYIYRYGTDGYERTKEQPIKIPLWWVILIALSCLTGWVNIVFFILFWILWGAKAGSDGIKKTSCTYWRLHSRTCAKVVKFLNKPIL